MKNRFVIVWGYDEYNSLGLIRQFGSAGLDVLFLVVGGLRNCASASCYITKLINVESIEQGYDYLINNYYSNLEKITLVNSADPIAEFIDWHGDELRKHFVITGTLTPGLLSKSIDKQIMADEAEEYGFLVPKALEIQKQSSIDGIKYPCILKPTHMTPGHYNEFKFKICWSERELRNTLSVVRPESKFMLQDYIKKECDILVYGARMCDGKTVIAGAILRDRFCGTGETSHGLITGNLPKGVDEGVISKYLESKGYYGLFSVEYGKAGNDAYFFEINLRNDGTSHFFFQAGANIPLAWFYSTQGIDYSNVPTKVQKDCYYIDEFFDIENVFKGVISWRQWKKEKKESTIFKYYDTNDMTPWSSMKKIRTKKIFQDIIVSKYRMYIVYALDKLNIRRK